MLKFLTSLLVLGALSGAAWVAFSIYRVKHTGRLVPVDEIMDRAEALANKSPPTMFGEKISAFLDAKSGRCYPATIPAPGTKEKSKPIEGKIFPFARLTEEIDVGTLCEFPGFGKETIFAPNPRSATFILRRRWQAAPLLTLQAGALLVTSNELYIEWAAPGTRVEIKSEGPAVLHIMSSATQPTVLLKAGKFTVTQLRPDLNSGPALPIRFGAFDSATMSSDGKKIVGPGESVYLLPSGFSELSVAPAAGTL